MGCAYLHAIPHSTKEKYIMHTGRLMVAVVGSLTAAALFASTAFADMVPVGSAGPPRPGNAVNVGDAMNLSVTGAQGGGEIFRMDYPGNSLPVELTARISGVPNTLMDSVGFDVYDAANGTVLVEHTTLGRNQLNSDPNLMEMAYSSGTAGSVTFQFFNWSGLPLSVSVMPLQLPQVPLLQVGPSIPGSATAVGISSVAGISISH
jgi:hypothetical protein